MHIRLLSAISSLSAYLYSKYYVKESLASSDRLQNDNAVCVILIKVSRGKRQTFSLVRKEVINNDAISTIYILANITTDKCEKILYSYYDDCNINRTSPKHESWFVIGQFESSQNFTVS